MVVSRSNGPGVQRALDADLSLLELPAATNERVETHKSVSFSSVPPRAFYTLAGGSVTIVDVPPGAQVNQFPTGTMVPPDRAYTIGRGSNSFNVYWDSGLREISVTAGASGRRSEVPVGIHSANHRGRPYLAFESPAC